MMSPNNEYRFPELWAMSLVPEVHRPPLAGLIARSPLLEHSPRWARCATSMHQI